MIYYYNKIYILKQYLKHCMLNLSKHPYLKYILFGNIYFANGIQGAIGMMLLIVYFTVWSTNIISLIFLFHIFNSIKYPRRLLGSNFLINASEGFSPISNHKEPCNRWLYH